MYWQPGTRRANRLDQNDSLLNLRVYPADITGQDTLPGLTRKRLGSFDPLACLIAPRSKQSHGTTHSPKSVANPDDGDHLTFAIVTPVGTPKDTQPVADSFCASWNWPELKFVQPPIVANVGL